MRRILIALAAGVLAVMGLAGTASASEHGGHGGHGGHGHAASRSYGHRFRGGVYYSHHDHPHWGRREWDGAHRRWQYWDPYLSVWYWYCPADSCYYPITYCP